MKRFEATMRRAWILTAILVLALSNFPASAEEPVTERVDRLEQGLEAVRRDVAELKALIERLVAERGADAGTLGGRIESLAATTQELEAEQAELAATLRGSEASLKALSEADRQRTQLTVYGTFNVIESDSADAVYDAEAFELVLSGQPHERLGFFAEIEFERAASVGAERGGEILIEQAYATYTLAPWMGLRAGVLLVPFGNVNVDHFAPNRDVISKPLVSYVVAPSDWTDNGFGFNGSVLLGDAWTFAYETYLVAGLDADVTALGTRAARQPFGVDNNHNKAAVGRFALNRGGWLELGVSGYSGKYDDGDRLRLSGWAADVLFEHGRLKLTGEYDRLQARQPEGPDAVLTGGYARAVVDVTPGWLRRGWHGTLFPGARLALVAQYDRADLEGPLDGGFETNVEERFTLGLNYRPSHHWVLKLQVEDSEATGRPLQRGDFRGFLGSIAFQF